MGQAIPLPAARLQIHEQPFRLTVQDGTTVLAEVSALFLETGAGRLGFRTWKAYTNIPGGKRLLYLTSDERLATVEVAERGGVIRLHFSVEEKQDSESLGLSLVARPGEHFAGLMERVVDGPADRSWQPNLREALDLRGQRVEMFNPPTPSLSSPFYLSSAGYGLWVEGSWPGYYDLAASHGDEVFLQWEGPALTVYLIPGPDPAAILAGFHKLAGPSLLPPKWAFGAESKSSVRITPSMEGVGSLVDFSNPGAVARWQGRIQGQLAAGRAFRLDGGPLDLPQELSVKMHDGRTARETHNDHPRLYQQAAFEAARKVMGDDFVLLAGSGYSGSQKFAVLGGGELPSTQWGLRAAIIAVQRAAAMGFPFWGAEAGGAAGPLDREVAARWIAFSAFNAVFQPGRTATEPELAPYLRFYGGLHQRLQEYSYRAAQQAHKTGLPVVRPLFLAFPRDPAAWDHWQQFLYGDDLLVGAVWQKGQASFPVYLPQGKWVDAWTAKEHTGPATVIVDTPGHKIPLFLRRGAKVSLGDLTAEWAVAQNRDRSQD